MPKLQTLCNETKCCSYRCQARQKRFAGWCNRLKLRNVFLKVAVATLVCYSVCHASLSENLHLNVHNNKRLCSFILLYYKFSSPILVNYWKCLELCMNNSHMWFWRYKGLYTAEYSRMSAAYMLFDVVFFFFPSRAASACVDVHGSIGAILGFWQGERLITEVRFMQKHSDS